MLNIQRWKWCSLETSMKIMLNGMCNDGNEASLETAACK